jgi:2-phosphosulfolactate phosphatase
MRDHERVNSRYLSITELTDTPKTAVVIDVMRAFTTTAWAFDRGAEKIILAATLEDALALKADHPDWVTLKDGAPAPGFDTVNSPGLMRDADLTGRTVVQKTTNGTVGAVAVRDADLVLCASFAVAGATAKLLRARASGDVTYVVTGENGTADEDLACAEYIAQVTAGPGTDATPFLDRAAKAGAAARLADAARDGTRGVHPDDAALCTELDRFTFAMVAAPEGPFMVLRPVPAPCPEDPGR